MEIVIILETKTKTNHSKQCHVSVSTSRSQSKVKIVHDKGIDDCISDNDWSSCSVSFVALLPDNLMCVRM